VQVIDHTRCTAGLRQRFATGLVAVVTVMIFHFKKKPVPASAKHEVKFIPRAPFVAKKWSDILYALGLIQHQSAASARIVVKPLPIVVLDAVIDAGNQPVGAVEQSVIVGVL